MHTDSAAVVHVLPAEPFRRKQRAHFAGAVLLPSVLAVALPFSLPTSGHPLLAAALLLGMWFVVGCVGVSVGLHRLYAHRSFEAITPLRWLLGACGQMAAQGPVVYWVSLHRMHHAASDRPGDPHSPQPRAWPGLRGAAAAWQGHLGWVLAHDVPKPTRYARDLIGDPVVRSLGRGYQACVAAGVVLPALIAWPLLAGELGHLQALAFGAYWGGVLRIALGHHVIWAINSCCHLRGDRPHTTGDRSANVGWLSLLSWGESWHNNHHAAPTAARFGRGLTQPDIGWCVVRLLVALRLARLRQPG